MSPESILIVVGGILIAISSAIILYYRLPKRVKTDHYTQKWREIQKMCRVRDDWAHAIIHADMLLDEVMVKKKVVGKTMGERMVSVEKKFSARDDIWGAHKLANLLRKNADHKISKTIVKNTLVSYRQALKDLGAL